MAKKFPLDFINSGDVMDSPESDSYLLTNDNNNVAKVINVSDLFESIPTEETHSYGVEIDVTISSPELFRVGNLDLHRTLPIQSKMRGCLIDGTTGAFIKYLNPTNWTSETRDGSQGQVMVEIPEHYRKFTTDGNIRQARISEYPIPGYHYVPTTYVSAYEASLASGMLRSVAGVTPTTNYSRTQFRTYARARGAGTQWNCYTYDIHKTICWLYYIEYANLNCQLPFNTYKDANGFAQGGLGNGATVANLDNWNNINGRNPFIPCGYTDSFGNFSGESLHSSSIGAMYVPRYRGVENIFGHIGKWLDGLNIDVRANGDGGTSTVYVADDPAIFNDANSNGYEARGLAARAPGFIREILFGDHGDIIPAAVGGSDSTYFCDYCQADTASTTTSLRGVFVGGVANYGTQAGIGYANLNSVPSYAHTTLGTRLCFIPQDN